MIGSTIESRTIERIYDWLSLWVVFLLNSSKLEEYDGDNWKCNHKELVQVIIRMIIKQKPKEVLIQEKNSLFKSENYSWIHHDANPKAHIRSIFKKDSPSENRKSSRDSVDTSEQVPTNNYSHSNNLHILDNVSQDLVELSCFLCYDFVALFVSCINFINFFDL